MKKKTSLLIYLFVFLFTELILNIACTKKDKDKNESTPLETTGSITDIDGNTYKTVKIGNQWWMAENLKTSKLNDGTAIPLIIDSIEWSNLSASGYCWYNNDQVKNKDTYGALYNWYTINTGKLCPPGWHVPTIEDWETLINFLGGESTAGGKLKESGYSHWPDPNTGATNESVFTALPGGYRYYDGDFKGNLYGGFWWSTTEIDPYDITYLYLYYRDSRIHKAKNYKRTGMSIRCVKD